MEEVAGLMVLFSILALVVIVMWVILPFYVAGIRKRLDVVIRLLKEQNNRGQSCVK